MQPLQYDLRSSAAKDNSITHAAAQVLLHMAPSNLDAATTMRSAETELQERIELRSNRHKLQLQNTDLDANDKKTILRTETTPKAAAAKIAHTEDKSFHRRLQPLYTEKHKVSCSGFHPHKIAHATLTQPLQCDLQPKIQEPHRTTRTDTTTALQNT